MPRAPARWPATKYSAVGNSSQRPTRRGSTCVRRRAMRTVEEVAALLAGLPVHRAIPACRRPGRRVPSARREACRMRPASAPQDIVKAMSRRRARVRPSGVDPGATGAWNFATLITIRSIGRPRQRSRAGHDLGKQHHPGQHRMAGEVALEGRMVGGDLEGEAVNVQARCPQPLRSAGASPGEFGQRRLRQLAGGRTRQGIRPGAAGAAGTPHRSCAAVARGRPSRSRVRVTTNAVSRATSRVPSSGLKNAPSTTPGIEHSRWLR